MPSSPGLTAPTSRQPPPSLFLGPPSHNSSHVSISAMPTAAALLNATNLPAGSTLNPRTSLLRTPVSRATPTSNPSTEPSPLRPPPPHPRHQAADDAAHTATAHTDALWAEMQSTLAEVSLSATSGTHVFGAEHSRALEELRTAQIALAQAWALSEADDAEGSGELAKVEAPVLRGASMLGLDPEKEARPARKGGDKEEPVRRERRASRSLEEETEKDILMARRRREANDRYFQRVNAGVLEVVSKLEDVAIAMRGVERESRDIWSGSDATGSTGTSIAAGPAARS